jgi:hypothetical protein
MNYNLEKIWRDVAEEEFCIFHDFLLFDERIKHQKIHSNASG